MHTKAQTFPRISDERKIATARIWRIALTCVVVIWGGLIAWVAS